MSRTASDEKSGRAQKQEMVDALQDLLRNRNLLSHRTARYVDEAEKSLRLSLDPHFYPKLYKGYADAGHLPEGAAALMALYCTVAATSDAFSLLHEGSLPLIETDDLGRLPVDAWVVAALVQVVGRFSSGESQSLQEAAGLRGGADGRAAMMRPYLDFEMLQAAAVARVRRASDSRPNTDLDAVHDAGSVADAKFPADARTGFGRRTSLDALRRVRAVLARI